VLAVALRECVFLWNASTGSTCKVVDTGSESNIITSVCWGANDILAIGKTDSEVLLWDTARDKEVRRINSHVARVCSLSWQNEYCVSSGSRDSTVKTHDLRSRQRVSSLEAHTQEVCGLKWCRSGTELASGGNDNKLMIWDSRGGVCRSPRLELTAHRAAVKALGWSPHQQHVLVSGGGTADRRLCIWNTVQGSLLNSVDTKSQVCAVEWSTQEKELVSSHGFTHNQLILWKYGGGGKLSKITELTGHQARVLHLSHSPEGSSVVSGAADETLRFWRIFGSSTASPARLKGEAMSSLFSGMRSIR